MGLFDFFTSDIAIDLGTANTLIINKDKIVVDEPSIIAIDKNTNKVLAIGREAMQMHEKTHENIKTIRPLKDGVIADFHAAEHMIRGMIKMIDNNKRWLPTSHRMVICIPSGITEVEERAVKDSAEQAGAKEVKLIHEPMDGRASAMWPVPEGTWKKPWGGTERPRHWIRRWQSESTCTESRASSLRSSERTSV